MKKYHAVSAVIKTWFKIKDLDTQRQRVIPVRVKTTPNKRGYRKRGLIQWYQYFKGHLTHLIPETSESDVSICNRFTELMYNTTI